MKTANPIVYVVGFLFSIGLTVAAYLLVGNGDLSHSFLVTAIFVLAFLQLIVQLIFFLHLGRESQRANLMAFLFAFGVVAIVVIGSLWIMYHLNYNMSGDQQSQYILKDEGIPR